ncbi:MAG: SpoIIE family protein phosphatase [Bacteroidales bacterium]|nr:SpoIIE family protein phosphatase [Bacteroidales bacterium]
MAVDLYIEVDAKQINHENEKICGDVFLKRRIKEDKRIIAVLSDGMGHGVKANVLATLTSTMALNFTIEHRKPERIAEIIMNTLPVCSERNISYSTFTVADLEIDGRVHLLEYDNPPALVFRNNEVLKLTRDVIVMNNPEHKGKKLTYTSFYPKLYDRIVFFSDGVAQSGMGTDKYPFGWENSNIEEYILRLLENENDISAGKLAEKVVNKAVANDFYKSKDDTSCASIYFREPRKLLIVTGPPIDRSSDKELATIVKVYNGKKIISGGSTTDLIARELKLKVTDSLDFFDNELPPISYMDGIDLVTEGILTLNKVWKILTDMGSDYVPSKGPADQIVKLILQSDHIDIIVGTKINEAHQDPNVPVDLEIRRTIAGRIADVLENKLLKHITVRHI